MLYYLQKKKNERIMNMIILKKQFVLLMILLFCGVVSYAADNGLITKQIIIKLEKAGTLSNKIGSSKRDKITNLKIVGEMNADDFDVVCRMGGDSGHLAILDLSEVKIVGNASTGTGDDILPDDAFYLCSGLTSLSLPSGVISIGESAFVGCSGLTSLSIPSNVTSIGRDAFYGCSGLTSLSFSSSTSIGNQAFGGCKSLKNVQYYINDDIESYLSKGHDNFRFGTDIKYFLSGQEMTNVKIPSNITKLGGYAFQKSINLTSVYVSWETPFSAGTAFDGVDVSKCTLYVPQGAYQDYWLADIWGDFGNILEYDVTGVKKVTTSTDAKEVFRYSVNGQRLSAPTKGLNIVKYSDGSMKKVAVR